MVRCKRCNTESPTGTAQCTNPSCRSTLKGNLLARKHGASSKNPDEKLAEIRESAGRFAEDAFRELCVDDEESDPSIVDDGYVHCLAEEIAIIETLRGYFAEHGILTPRGRVRASVSVLQQAITKYDALVQRLEERRQKRQVETLRSGY